MRNVYHSKRAPPSAYEIEAWRERVAALQMLYELETADNRLDQQQHLLESVRLRLAGTGERAAAMARVETVRADLRELESRQRGLERDIENEAVNVRRWSEKLYGGTVHDARELNSLQHEIEMAAQRRSQREDELLEAMEQFETGEATLRQAEQRVREVEARQLDERARLHREDAELTEEIEALRRRRDEIAGGLDPTQLARYERLRRSTGHAVAEVVNGTCQWCRVQVPARDVQHARAGELVACTNCGRVLFAR